MAREIFKGTEHSATKGTLALGVFSLIAAAVAKEIEMTRNDRRQRDDQAITIDTPGNGDLSMIFVVGNSADGEQYAKQLAPHLKDLGDTHFIAYPKKGFSVDSIGDKFLEATEKSDGKRQAVICFSMGQMVVNYLMSKPKFADEAGDIDFLISDSGVTKISNLHPKTQALLNIGGRVPVTHTIAELYAYFRKLGAAEKEIEHDVDISDDEIREHNLSTALTSLYANSPQWRFMLHAAILAPGSLAEVGSRIPVKEYISAVHDPVVNETQSFQDQNELYGGGWSHTRSTRRAASSHATGADHPADFREILKKPVIRKAAEKFTQDVAPEIESLPLSA